MTGLNDWYERTEGDDLLQGDILENCPIFTPAREMDWPPAEGEEIEAEFDAHLQDVIVLSQSCDIQKGQKSDQWLVLLCPFWALPVAAAVNPYLNSSVGKEECRRGNLNGYHMIAECTDDKWSREIGIVSFREIYSLPLDFVRSFANNSGPRTRIRSPYREHLAQAFARYFMRVGLPVDIPGFSSDKAEAEVIKKLNAMDDEEREKIFSAFKE